jgi:FlaA1/EpsC-like NDP-sugar epimerase
VSVSALFKLTNKMLSSCRTSLVALGSLALLTSRPVFCSSVTACEKPDESKCKVKTAVARPVKSPLTDLRNKVVLVTGATAGIGAACAWRFAEEGARLVLVGRRADRLRELKIAIEEAYPDIAVHTVPLSITDFEEVAKLPTSLPPDFQEIDILVNNAGLAKGVNSVEENNMNDAKEVLETNVLGTIAMCSAFLPGMKERGRGHVVNMGSVAVSLIVTDLFLC